jgi:hypothetical protein
MTANPDSANGQILGPTSSQTQGQTQGQLHDPAQEPQERGLTRRGLLRASAAFGLATLPGVHTPHRQRQPPASLPRSRRAVQPRAPPQQQPGRS